MSHEASGNCSDELFILGGFLGVEFPPVTNRFFALPEIGVKKKNGSEKVKLERNANNSGVKFGREF